MRSRLTAVVLAAGLLATACGVESQDAPEPLDPAPSPPARTPTVSEVPDPTPSPTTGGYSPRSPTPSG